MKVATAEDRRTMYPAVCLPGNSPCVRCGHKRHGPSSSRSPHLAGEMDLRGPWASMGSTHRLWEHRGWSPPDLEEEWAVVVKVRGGP